MKRTVAVLISGVVFASFAAAQGAPGSVELSPVVGYWFGDTLGRGVSPSFDFDVEVDDTPMYGLRLGYRFAENWAMEGLFAKGEADLTYGAGDLFGSGDRFGSMEMTVGEIGVEGSFGHRRLVPFLAGGVGAMLMKPKVAGMSTSSDTRVVANFGGGFKLFFSPAVALRFDWRSHAVKVGEDDGCDWWDDCHYNDQWMNFTEVALGLSFIF